MANSIKIKRSAVAAKVPLTTDIELGELAINTYDGKLYLKKDNGTASIVTVNAGSGAALSNDTTTATQLYPIFADATTGTPVTVYTSNAKLLYKPSTGELAVTAPIAANALIMNATTVATSYTIAAGFNACSVGPVTVNGGVAVTITAGQRWLVL